MEKRPAVQGASKGSSKPKSQDAPRKPYLGKSPRLRGLLNSSKGRTMSATGCLARPGRKQSGFQAMVHRLGVQPIPTEEQGQSEPEQDQRKVARAHDDAP